MTIVASIHGRAGADPVRSTTQSGKDMCRVSLAVDVADYRSEDADTLWCTVMCFGATADALARCHKGEMVAAMGKLTRGRYQGKDGQPRESWSLIADSVLVAASARPSGKARRDDDRPPERNRVDPARDRASRAFQAPDFDDPVEF